MLVIRRREGESLLIADNIEIEILELSPTHVKLGIRAPREIVVLRKEVELTRQQNRAAASSLTPESLAGLLDTIPALSKFTSSSPDSPER